MWLKIGQAHAIYSGFRISSTFSIIVVYPWYVHVFVYVIFFITFYKLRNINTCVLFNLTKLTHHPNQIMLLRSSKPWKIRIKLGNSMHITSKVILIDFIIGGAMNSLSKYRKALLVPHLVHFFSFLTFGQKLDFRTIFVRSIDFLRDGFSMS